jgi:hypothetical protein
MRLFEKKDYCYILLNIFKENITQKYFDINIFIINKKNYNTK